MKRHKRILEFRSLFVSDSLPEVSEDFVQAVMRGVRQPSIYGREKLGVGDFFQPWSWGGSALALACSVLVYAQVGVNSLSVSAEFDAGNLVLGGVDDILLSSLLGSSEEEFANQSQESLLSSYYSDTVL